MIKFHFVLFYFAATRWGGERWGYSLVARDQYDQDIRRWKERESRRESEDVFEGFKSFEEAMEDADQRMPLDTPFFQKLSLVHSLPANMTIDLRAFEFSGVIRETQNLLSNEAKKIETQALQTLANPLAQITD